MRQCIGTVRRRRWVGGGSLEVGVRQEETGWRGRMWEITGGTEEVGGGREVGGVSVEVVGHKRNMQGHILLLK